jgi:CheY-like chemotaxis protein
VLVAEDNSVNQKVVLLQLQKLGFKADAVGSGVEAVHALENLPYDVVLMDCQMPEMDGYAATAAIRRQENGKRHIPIIAMTAHAMSGDRERCIKAGMDDYIAKPVRTLDLAAILAKWTPVAEKAGPTKTRARRSSATSGGITFRAPEGLDSPSLRRELAELFLQHTPGLIQQMKGAYEQKNVQGMRIPAHTLKGSCANVGLAAMADLCRRIEDAAEAGTIANVDEALAGLGRAYEQVEQYLEKNILKRSPS